jgi:roadblock/LC7 domain-containing protein
MQVLETIALGYQQLSGRNLTPARGWVYVGGDSAAVVRDGRWTVLHAEEGGFGRRPSGSPGELLARCGALDVGETDAEGRLVAHETRIGLSEELAATGARFVHTVTGVTDSLAEVYSILSGLDWRPAAGWAYEGGDWIVAVGGRRWVLVPAQGNDVAEVQRRVLG